jgi:hypothetical protein
LIRENVLFIDHLQAQKPRKRHTDGQIHRDRDPARRRESAKKKKKIEMTVQKKTFIISFADCEEDCKSLHKSSSIVDVLLKRGCARDLSAELDREFNLTSGEES